MQCSNQQGTFLAPGSLQMAGSARGNRRVTRHGAPSPRRGVEVGLAFCLQLLLQHNLARCSVRAGLGDRIRVTEPCDRVGRVHELGSLLSL